MLRAGALASVTSTKLNAGLAFFAFARLTLTALVNAAVDNPTSVPVAASGPNSTCKLAVMMPRVLARELWRCASSARGATDEPTIAATAQMQVNERKRDIR